MRRWNKHETFANEVEALGADVICFQGLLPPFLSFRRAIRHTHANDVSLRMQRRCSSSMSFRQTWSTCPDSTPSSPAQPGLATASAAAVWAFMARPLSLAAPVAVPVKAEAGLTYRSAVESAGLFGLVGAYPPGLALRKKEESLEQDGRCIILDFGLFVLINVCVACRFTLASSASLPYSTTGSLCSYPQVPPL